MSQQIRGLVEQESLSSNPLLCHPQCDSGPVIVPISTLSCVFPSCVCMYIHTYVGSYQEVTDFFFWLYWKQDFQYLGILFLQVKHAQAGAEQFFMAWSYCPV